MWPGKSDLDQLFLICKNLGELLPSQMQLFNGNKFYAGLTIPNPGPIEPLEEKVPVKIIGKDGMEVLKVVSLLLLYSVFHQFRQAKFVYGGSILSLSQFLLLAQQPLKNDTRYKSGQID